MIRELRRRLARIIYPEIFIQARVLQFDLKETEDHLERAKKVLKGEGKLITLGRWPISEDSPIA